MKIMVLLKMVPDVVEELEVAGDGKSLNADFLRMILNERDGHALEEGLLLKEPPGGPLTVGAPDAPEVDNELFTAMAKGADRAVKIVVPPSTSSRAMAAAVAQAVAEVPGLLPVDLVLTGCQAIDDWDGMAAPLLAHAWSMPYVGLVTQVAASDGTVVVTKEYAGGFHGEFELQLPAVLGVQAAEQPPRYVPVAKVRAAMKTQKLEEVPFASLPAVPRLEILRMSKPASGAHAEMLEGTPEEVAAKICRVLVERGVI
jgi:electron transfer flavoprotein beta subunit